MGLEDNVSVNDDDKLEPPKKRRKIENSSSNGSRDENTNGNDKLMINNNEKWITIARKHFLHHIDFCAMKSGYYLDNVYNIQGLLSAQEKLDIFEKRLRADTVSSVDDQKKAANNINNACALSLSVEDIYNMKPLLLTCEPLESKVKGTYMYKVYSQPVKDDHIYRFTVSAGVQKMKWIVFHLGEVIDAADRCNWVWFFISHNKRNINCEFFSSDSVGVKIPQQWKNSQIIEDTYTFPNERNFSGNLNVNVVLDYKYTNTICLCDSRDTVVASIHIGRENRRYFRYMVVVGKGGDGFQIKAESAGKLWPTTLVTKNKNRQVAIPTLSN